MDEQRAWLRAKRKRRLRILAVILSVCVLFTTCPDILETLSVSASEEPAQSEVRYIFGFTALSDEIREQTVPVGTGLMELTLPDTLEAVITEERQSSNNTVHIETEDKSEESRKEDTGENDGNTAGPEDANGSMEEPEEGGASDTGQEETEEAGDMEAGGENGDEQDTQPEEDGESEETGGSAETDNEDEADAENEEGGEGESAPLEKQSKSETMQRSTSSEEQQKSAVSQETHTVVMQKYFAEHVIPVQTLENTQTENQEETVMIDGVTWQFEPEYDGSAEGTYTFTAVLPDGYALAEGVSLPEITVTVESGTDSVIQALLERIAALPDAQEYLATEPDMEEDAFAEWEEKLYEYAEEALAIWEEYEALTEEQQVQILEDELAKLGAWMELAETLAESSQVMAAVGGLHTHCVCGGKLMGGEYNHTEESVVYDNILASQNGQLLLNSNPVTRDEQSGYQLTSRNYYLADDVALDSELVITEGSEVYICLNNHTISYNRENGKHRVITVEKGAKLYLCTCGDSGVITGGDIAEPGGGLYLIENSIFNMYGGSIEGNHATVAGGGIFSDASCNLYKVNICGNKGANGAGIIFSGTLNIYGGQIKNNEAENYGGGIATGSAQNCILQNVKICNNTAGGHAGGLYWSNGNLVMSDVEISNNIVSNSTARYQAGGVALMQGTISVSGAITISGNQYNGSPNNLCNTNANPRNPGKLFVAGTLDEQSVIGLTHKIAPTETAPDPVEVASGNNHTISPADWSRFFSDDDTYEILLDKTNNRLLLSYPGSCDLFTLSTSGATLSPSPFDPSITEYTSTVANSVDEVGITATLADTASGADITIKINDGAETLMENGVEKPASLEVGKNTIVITVTSGEMSKAYTIKITREEAKGNPVTITAYKDGAEWTGTEAPSDYKLTSDDGKTFLPGLVAPDGTYKIYIGDIDTGVEVTVAGAETSARVDYHTVTFYDGATELTAPAQQTVLKGAAASAPADNPTKTGYTFSKWVTADGGSTAYDFANETVTGKTSVYAGWTPVTYKITYNLAGGTLPAGKTNPADYTIETADFTLQNPERAGYAFAGWSGTGLAADSTTVTISKGSTGNREYTANWTAKTYGITLNGNGGTGDGLTGYTYGQGALLPENWTKTGYTFAGWYGNKDCTGTPVTEISATDTGDKTYWAKWTPQTYQVTFNYHGADGGDATASQTVTYGSTYGTLPVPSKTGCTFKGWHTEENGQGSKVDAETIVTTASAHILHARWKDETAPDKPVLQDGVTLPADWTNKQDKIPLKLYDGVGVTGLLVSVDGSPYAEVNGFSGGTGSVLYDYTPVPEGEHTYWFKAKDAAGNVSEESVVFTVKLDQTKPVIGTPTYENEVHLNLWHWIIGKKSMIIHVPVTDTGSGVTEISCTLTPRDADGNLDGSKAAEKKAAVKDGEAKITFDKDFRGTITINCTDAAGNKADSVTVGADAGGVIVEDTAPEITTDAKTDYYDTPTEIRMTVKDDTQNAITAGIAAVKYKVEDGTEQPVTINTSALQAQVTFTIPASEISTGVTQITVTATDNAGNEAAKRFTVKVRGPEKQPAAKIDYREEKLTKLVPGEKYTVDGTEYTADGEGCIPIKEDWFNSTVDIVKKGTGSETTDSPAQSLPIPARPAAPNAPDLNTRTENSITLKTIPDAQYRLADGTQNWQESTAFTGLDQKTVYKFRAYYPATDTGFASLESDEAQIATMPTAPTPDKLKISYTAETLTLTDGIEAFTDPNCTTPVTAGSVETYMGQTLYIRYPANGIIPESLTTAVPIPARPEKPAPATEDASYPTATDGAITELTSGKTYEYRVKNKDGGFSEWKEAVLNGTRIENLPAGEYEVRVKAVEAEGNAGFQSEAAAVTIGEKPAARHETPDIRIDYTAEVLTGFVPGVEYMINGETITADADGIIKIETGRFGTTLSIVRKGNGKDKLDSDAQSLPIPARPEKPAPTGVDVNTAGGTGKLTRLTAGVAYEVSTDGGKTWVSQTADGSGEITGLAPGSYTVRVKAGVANFASENSAPAEIDAYKVKVTFMANGEKYKEIILDYGTTLTDIPSVPPKKDAGDQVYTGEWCSDDQGTPAVFANITADMTVYAVYTTVYTVTLQTGTGYTLSAETGSDSPVKEGGSFTFRFALSRGYRKTSDFALKVNGVKVELTADGAYTISNVRENKTVTVEGVAKKTGGKPSNSGGGDKGDDAPKPTPPSSGPSDNTPSTPPVKPPAEVTPPAPETAPPAAEKKPEGRKSGTTPEKEENREQEEDEKTKEEQEPKGTDTKEQEPDSADVGQTEKEPQAEKREVQIGDGTVIVTVVCEEEKCTATVADTEKVVKAVLTPGQQESVNSGETIEIRIDVTDISDRVPRQDKEVIEGGIEAYREEVPGLVLGMYVDISLFIRIGTGDWDAVTETKEPIEVAVGIPEELQSGGREFYIIRAHNGEYTFMNDLDDVPETITVSTDLFSSYAIAYVETDETGTDDGAECGLCHICPTFLGICCFIWLAVIIALVLILYIIWRKKRQKEEKQEK